MKVSASRMGLFELCQYFARDDVEWPRVRPENKLGARGTAGHKLIEAHYERVALGQPLPNPADFTQALTRGDARYIQAVYRRFTEDPVSRAQFRPERAFVYSVGSDSARSLPSTDRRNYIDLAPDEIPGTPDLTNAEPQNRRVHVADIKLGEGNESRGLLSDAQGDFNGLSVARNYDAETAVITELDLTLDGVRAKQRTLGPGALAAIAAKVRRLSLLVPKAEPQPGLHCTEMWCPIRGTCPASQRAQMALAPDRTALEMNIERPEQAARVLYAIRVIRAAADFAEAHLNAYVDDQPGQYIVLPDGRRYQRSETVQRTIDLSAPGAVDLLKGSGFGDAIVATTSRERLEEVGRSEGLVGGALDRLIEKVMDSLDSIGAIHGKEITSHEISGRRRARAEPREIEPPADSAGAEPLEDADAIGVSDLDQIKI
jgi:hypothetical protein